MNPSDLLTDTKLHARVDGGDDDAGLLLMLAAAAGDVAHAANYTLPASAAVRALRAAMARTDDLHLTT